MNSHLKGLGLENFRVFKEKTWFDFAPINILTGTNNSGKSTVVKAANLLQNFFEQRGIKTQKHENPDFLDIEELLNILGDFSKLPNYKSDSQTISFYLPIVLRGMIDKMLLELVFKLQPGTLKQGKLTGMSIHTPKNETPIFSVTEVDKSKYKVAINYLFFFEEYKRESLKIQEYESTESEEQRSIIYPEYHAFKCNQESINNDYSYRPFFDRYPGFYNSETELFHEPKYNNVFYSPNEVLFEYTNPDYRAELKIKDQIKNEREFLENFEFTLECITDEDAKIKYGFDPERNEKDQSVFYDIFQSVRTGNAKNEIKQKSLTDYCSYLQFPLQLFHDEGRQIDHRNKFYRFFEFSKDKFNGNEIVNILSTPGGFFQITQPENPKDKNVEENGEEREENLSMSNFFFKYFVAWNLFYSIDEAFSIFKNSTYISTFRNQSKRSYSVNQGDQLAMIVKKIIEAKEDPDNAIYLSFVNQYLSIFEIGGSLQITRTFEGQDYIYINNKGNEILLADLGYGVSQVLPLLLQICLTAIDNPGTNAKLFIEEPETNLHPALQSKLADMFVDAGKKFNIQFIIETHSEYLIRKLQFLTAKGVITPNDTNIYYFYPPGNVPGGEKQVKKISIQEDGSLSDDFGSGFFDEADNIALELFLLKKNQYN